MTTKNPVAKFAHQFNRNKVHTPKQNAKDHRRGLLNDSDDGLFLEEAFLEDPSNLEDVSNGGDDD